MVHVSCGGRCIIEKQYKVREFVENFEHSRSVGFLRRCCAELPLCFVGGVLVLEGAPCRVIVSNIFVGTCLVLVVLVKYVEAPKHHIHRLLANEMLAWRCDCLVIDKCTVKVSGIQTSMRKMPNSA